jgi:hypothetical protein
MTNGFYIEGKKVSIKYNLMTLAKPKKRSFLGQEASNHFPLQFEVLHNRKLNRRTSFFYLFEKHLFPHNLTNRFFVDHYIDEVRFDELQADGEGAVKWALSDLVLLEKTHIYNLLLLTNGMDENSFSFSNFGEIYEKATIFPLDLIEKEFIEIILLGTLDNIFNFNDRNLKDYFWGLQGNSGFIEMYEFYSHIIKKLNTDSYASFLNILEPYLTIFRAIKEFLKPEIVNFNTVTVKGQHLNSGRISQNLVTMPTWILGSYNGKLVSFLNSQNFDEFSTEFSLRIIKDVNSVMMQTENKIIHLFRE